MTPADDAAQARPAEPRATTAEAAELVQIAAQLLAEKALMFLVVSNSATLAPRIPEDELKDLMHREVLAKMTPADFAATTTAVLRGRSEVVVDEAAWTVALTVAGTYMRSALDVWALQQRAMGRALVQ